MRRAVIDIGTNTVKLLVAEIQNGQLQPVASKDATTRLGEGTDQTKRLSQGAINRTVAAISTYVSSTPRVTWALRRLSGSPPAPLAMPPMATSFSTRFGKRAIWRLR